MRKLLFCIILSLFSSCLIADSVGAKKAQNSSRPVIVASIRPLALIAKDLAGDHIDLRVLIEKAASPHDFSLTIGQALMLNDADALLWVGPDFERFLNKGVTTPIKLAMLNESHIEEHKHEHDHEGLHPWLSIEEVKHYAELISEYLSQAQPEFTQEFAERLKIFKRDLQSRRGQISKSLRPNAKQLFSVYHDGYGEFVTEHNLTQPIIITKVPHERVSAKRLNALSADMAKVSCILSETAEMSQAQRYANLFEKPLVGIDLLATEPSLSSFDSYLESIQKAFGDCLLKKTSS